MSTTTGTTSCEVKDVTSLPTPPSSSSSFPPKKWVLFFWAPWHDESKKGGTMDIVFTTLASTTSPDQGVEFGRVEAEAVPDLSRKVSE